MGERERGERKGEREGGQGVMEGSVKIRGRGKKTVITQPDGVYVAPPHKFTFFHMSLSSRV